ncbi:MAG: hypothetical protein R3F61_24620 [Myxococcota bacterium]
MTDDRTTHSTLGELADELRLQAWLARKEFADPSLHDPEVHAEASALARMRDEIRVQLHLGELDARDQFEKVEATWASLMRNDIQPAADGLAVDLENAAHDLLREIRDAYHGLLKKSG